MPVLKTVLSLLLFQVVRSAVYQHKVTPTLTPLAKHLKATVAAGGRGNSTITVQHQSKALELYVVAVGTPPQNFHVWLTGWSQFWVMDSGCTRYNIFGSTSTPCPGEPQPGYKRAFFNESASSTLIKAHREDMYLISGWLATDVFQLGGLQVKNMKIVLADQLSEDVDREYQDLKDLPIDGMLGLGPGTPWDPTGGFASPLQQIVPLLDKPMFTFALSGHQEQKAGTGAGVLTYGALDTVNCANDWHYVDAANDLDGGGNELSTWRAFIDGYSFVAYSRTTDNAAVEFDTGSDGLQLPDDLLMRVVKAADAEYDFKMDFYLCDCNVKLPDIVVSIGARNYSIPSSEYVLDIQCKPGRCILNLSSGYGDLEGPFMLGAPSSAPTARPSTSVSRKSAFQSHSSNLQAEQSPYHR